MTREEDVRARQEERRNYYEEISALRQKAEAEGSESSVDFLRGMKAIGRKYGFSMPWPDLAEGPDDMVPEVDPDKLKDALADYRGRGGMVGFAGLPHYQGPTEEAEADAVCARAIHLRLLESVDTAKLPEGVPDLFSVLKKDGRISDTAIRVFARFPLKKMVLGNNSLDIEGFIREVQRENSKTNESE